MTGPIILDLQSPFLSKEEAMLLEHPCVGGVILFERNALKFERDTLIQLTHTIRALRNDLLIMVDHEGGHIQRFRTQGFHALISAGALGRLYDRNQSVAKAVAHEEGYRMASELSACGIDLSFTPVLDLHRANNPIIGALDRAFHQDPTIVSILGRAYIEGMHEAGMPSIAKHFPGHGTCTDDSHLHLPVVHKTEAQLFEEDLYPFRTLIKTQHLDAIMPAHILYPHVDPIHATTYSHHWLHDILRIKLGFEGLIISDCLGMKGADIGTLSTRAHRALEAGCDMLIVANQTLPTQQHLLNHLPDIVSPRIAAFQQRLRRSQLTLPINPNKHQAALRMNDPHNPTITI